MIDFKPHFGFLIHFFRPRSLGGKGAMAQSWCPESVSEQNIFTLLADADAMICLSTCRRELSGANWQIGTLTVRMLKKKFYAVTARHEGPKVYSTLA